MFIPLFFLINTVTSWFSPFYKKRYWQYSDDQNNLLKHCAGMGPYVQGSGFGFDYDEIPMNLVVDRVFVFSRHGERYPTVDLELSLRAVYDKLKETKVDRYEGPMSFVEKWDYFITNRSLIEMETNTSQFSGLKDMHNFGQDIRQRYGEQLYKERSVMPFFTSGSQRVIDSSEAFARGFFDGDNNEELAKKMVIIPENKNQGYDTLTTGKSCDPYHKKNNYPHPYVPRFMKQEAMRLNKLSPGFNMTAADVKILAQYCAFELNVKGHSDVCDALSMDTFIEYEYLHDSEVYYTNAEHPYTFILGSVYVNATLQLLNEKNPEQKMYFSFTHDTDLLFYMNALGILDHQERKLPIGRIEFSRFFKTSELVPMGARIVLERLTHEKTQEKYVRVIINDAVIPLKSCQDGPSFTCKLSTLNRLFYEKLSEQQTFGDKCNVDKKYPQYLKFYWDWKQYSR
ncbi:hypothetical protein FOA43_001269 [Brettanomyces nanus]|uniref:Acid phosphatase n=1 Tax=Eeniella nana TaxID=13502 RepID=A0A875S3U4_EENNA|nr:uncharacterized protein FOA43_001269 [Brettanomyces nanus]QPG73954.1 hypothetical protein FOA43_001269 [Brettanomyces nanus]